MSDTSMFDLSGHVAIVTGGNGGIGRSLALGLARAGSAVAIFGRNEQKNAAVLEELEALGAKAAALRVDVMDRAALEPAVARVEESLGAVSVLINNAGNAEMSGGVLVESEDSWDSVVATHLNATFLLSKYAGQRMAERKRGKIINIGSMYSIFGSSFAPSYASVKGAIVQFTKSMAIEMAPHKVQVNAILPGWIETAMTAPIKELPMQEQILQRTPAGRWGQPGELEGLAIFLASSASDFITGESIRVDGGYAIS